jgi:hypothetical protein
MLLADRLVGNGYRGLVGWSALGAVKPPARVLIRLTSGELWRGDHPASRGSELRGVRAVARCASRRSAP